MARIIIFSDIDGTLIDFEQYSFAETAGTVAAVVGRGVPLVLCSSKTRTEQAALREALGIPDPFIVENGSAIFIQPGTFDFDFPHRRLDGFQVIETGLPAGQIRTALAAAGQATGLELRGLDALSVTEVAQATGLDEAAAARARQRDYSETIVTPLTSADLATVRASPPMRRLNIVSGGRFHTVTGSGADKGAAVKILAGLYRRQLGDIVTIGLGDSANDRPMLAAVDRPYLVQKPGGTWEVMDVPGLVRVSAVGPSGWREVMSEELRLMNDE
ncbi:MAG: HAD-IIB family hydrolase [Chloroflexota bacterium]|jgi:mannosyl-3-phosphoglycerate phosphatase